MMQKRSLKKENMLAVADRREILLIDDG